MSLTKNILITGSSGMVGNIILNKCLQREDVNSVTCFVRKSTTNKHPKLIEIVHENFLDFSGKEHYFKNKDICFYCIGVYTGAVPKEDFNKITIDYTAAFSKTLKQESTDVVFSFLSGQGADSSEKSPVLFAKSKGVAENILKRLKFKQLNIFRPGYIYPVKKRREPNTFYRIFRPLYKYFFSFIYPNIGISSVDLANVMIDVAFKENPKEIFENKDIRERI